ncbi:hypothetical protein [Polyangium sp. 15x6]|uniref:hypothetical protein n=1 Tax=Polyangium sp. 15x6 TaxID=3042687 RepID=UPI00249B8F8D|nr:hypothetical protein [Polyangium sp. 15x6]MDI3291064.1 hypothetical protein [Polyangium sp. 15x6]
MPTPAEVKKALIAAGFEVFRTRGDVVHVAERARENLIMDSGVRVHAGEVAVGLVLRAQRSDFPQDPDDAMFERARGLGVAARERGYHEVGTQITRLPDPSDEERTLDSWFEVSFEKRVAGLDEAMAEVGFALSLEKAASRS